MFSQFISVIVLINCKFTLRYSESKQELNMFSKIKKWLFKSKKEKVSITTTGEKVTRTTEHPTIVKIQNSQDLSITDINLMMSDIYNCKALGSKFHKFHKVLVEEALFEVVSVDLIEEKDGSSREITIGLREAVYGISMSINVDPREFHDVFRELKIKPDKEVVKT